MGMDKQPCSEKNDACPSLHTSKYFCWVFIVKVYAHGCLLPSSVLKFYFIIRGSTQGPWGTSFLRRRDHTSITLGDIQQGQWLWQWRRQGQLWWKRWISWRFWFSGNKANSFRGGDHGVWKQDNGLVALKCEALIKRAQLVFEGGRYCNSIQGIEPLKRHLEDFNCMINLLFVLRPTQSQNFGT